MEEASVTCKECFDLLLAYVDGEVAAETAHAFDAHMQRCPPCLEYLKSYRKTPELARAALEKHEVPGEIVEQVRAFLRAKRQG